METATPSLGRLAAAWMRHFGYPGAAAGVYVPDMREHAGFLAAAYEINAEPRNQHLNHEAKAHRLDYQLAAAIALFEAFGPCRFAGWAEGGEVYRDPWSFGFRHEYRPGEPMGKPVAAPFIRLVCETGFSRVYAQVRAILANPACPLSRLDLRNGTSGILGPDRVQIRPASPRTAMMDGGLDTWACFEGDGEEGSALHHAQQSVRRNLWHRQRTPGAWLLRMPTVVSAW